MAKKRKLWDTTEEHFEYYQTQIHRWFRFWHEMEWRIYLEHKMLKEALAAYYNDNPGRTVTIALSKKWSCEPTKKLLSKCAFHEATEVMLETLSRWCSGHPRDIEEAVHTIVRRMENTIFEKEWTNGELHGTAAR